MKTEQHDVVVVGLGAFGSAALWRLAQRGVDVAGVERHGIGHEHGSSHGETRLFRIACMEHPGLAPIAAQSLRLWTELGEQVGQTLVRQTGCLNVGAPDSRAVRGAREAGVPVEELTHDELAERYPQYALDSDDVAVWDPGAGICYPERNVRAHVQAAQALGATVYEDTVLGVEETTVRTRTSRIKARKVVVAAGSGLIDLIPDLPLTYRPTPVNWFEPAEPFALDRFPAFIWQRPDHGLWGHGADAGHAVKIGVHPEAETDLENAVAQAFPGMNPKPVRQIPCHVTDSPDGQFLVGQLTGDLIVAGGDSGHGFKHAAGVGELLAQFATGEKPYCDTAFLDPRRFFGSSSNG